MTDESEMPLWVVRLLWYALGWVCCWMSYVGGLAMRRRKGK